MHAQYFSLQLAIFPCSILNYDTLVFQNGWHTGLDTNPVPVFVGYDVYLPNTQYPISLSSINHSPCKAPSFVAELFDLLLYETNHYFTLLISCGFFLYFAYLNYFIEFP